ncbi:MAG: hypothetical protein ONB44_09525 [candidate division KSB1 bacterium]|nr:hypothetical protein [candidate division KSB1 bacterium]MDZ7302368.1 hypothetical protein [candidate division KSB1 bacterium]MDZ7313977.1 hypothetical protein [candidate division KSB1 bacterium]
MPVLGLGAAIAHAQPPNRSAEKGTRSASAVLALTSSNLPIIVIAGVIFHESLAVFAVRISRLVPDFPV